MGDLDEVMHAQFDVSDTPERARPTLEPSDSTRPTDVISPLAHDDKVARERGVPPIVLDDARRALAGYRGGTTTARPRISPRRRRS